MKQSPGNVFDYVTFKLDRLNGMMTGLASKMYLREFQLSIRELRILRVTEVHPGLNLGKLTELSVIEKTIVSKLVTGLCERGYLIRHIDGADARKLKLELTERGQAVVTESYRFSVEMEMDFLRNSSLGADELQSFLLSIEKLTGFMELAVEKDAIANSEREGESR